MFDQTTTVPPISREHDGVTYCQPGIAPETPRQAADRLGLRPGDMVTCADGVNRPIKSVQSDGMVRVQYSRELIDPRKLKRPS